MAGIGSAPGIILGVGVGAAAGAALEPAIEVPRQQAWLSAPNRVLDPNTVARLVAQGGIALDATAYDQANRSGYSNDKLDALVYLAQTVPGVAEALFLWRLGYTDETGYRAALTKLGIREDWQDLMVKTYTVPLTAEQVAVMLQRSVIPNQGQLPGVVHPAQGQVPQFPVVPIDAYASAQAYGVDNDMLDALSRIQGLPPGMDTVARGVFRNILDRSDFDLAAAQANRRVEWAPFEFDIYRQILTPVEYTELQLRGFSTADERRADTAKFGMSDEDSDKLYNVLGRAPALHTIVIGLARGGVYNGPTDDIPDVFLSAMQRSNIRPEYYNIVYAARYSYPSPFVIRTLATSGELGDENAVEQILLNIGWPPDLAASVAAQWVPTGTAVDANLKKAHTSAWSAAQRSYIAEESTAQDVQPIFDLLGIATDTQAQILASWDAIRALTRKQLSPAQIKKALGDGVTNPATGSAWTMQDATDALLARGYDADDAQTFLTE